MAPRGGAYWSASTAAELGPVEQLEHPALKATYACWQRAKGERAMPRREDISARELGSALRMIHLYEVLVRDYRFRIIGTGVFPGLADDQTGKTLSNHPDPGVRLRFAAALDRVVATGSPVRSTSLRKTGDLLQDAHTEGLWLPLGSDGCVVHVLAQSALTILTPDSDGFGDRAGTLKN